MPKTYTPRPMTREEQAAAIQASLAWAVRQQGGGNYEPSKRGSK